MDIAAKIKEKDTQYEQLKSGVFERQNKIQTIKNEADQNITSINGEIQQISAEMNRIQGEYRMLVEIGIESGILNKDGTLKEVPDPEKKPDIHLVKSDDEDK